MQPERDIFVPERFPELAKEPAFCCGVALIGTKPKKVYPQYIALIWLVASLAMVGGALGAGLEADSTVREAAYGYRPDVEEPPPAQPEAG